MSELLRRAEEHLAAATIKLTHERPYLGAALWAMQRILVPPRKEQVRFTMAVSNRWVLYVDPQTMLDHWDVPMTASVLYHEVLHLLREHAARRPLNPDDAALWNFACDAEINDDLRNEKMPLGPGVIVPETLGCVPGKLAEEYWSYLLITGRTGKNLCEEMGIPYEWWQSSGASGVKMPWEDEGAESDGLTPEQRQVLRQQVARETLEHARTRGYVPDHLKRWADALVNSRVDWRTELATLLRRALGDIAGQVDYSYRRPSRRQAAYGSVIAPTLRQPLLEAALVVDTSGSMDESDLSACLSEIDGVLRSGFTQAAKVLTVDAAVHACQQVFAASQVNLGGGGGTDMGVGIEAAALLRPRPGVIIVLTDGYTPWPAVPPAGIEVIVVLTRPDAASYAPAWARVLVLPEHR